MLKGHPSYDAMMIVPFTLVLFQLISIIPTLAFTLLTVSDDMKIPGDHKEKQERERATKQEGQQRTMMATPMMSYDATQMDFSQEDWDYSNQQYQ